MICRHVSILSGSSSHLLAFLAFTRRFYYHLPFCARRCCRLFCALILSLSLSLLSSHTPLCLFCCRAVEMVSGAHAAAAVTQRHCENGRFGQLILVLTIIYPCAPVCACRCWHCLCCILHCAAPIPPPPLFTTCAHFPHPTHTYLPHTITLLHTPTTTRFTTPFPRSGPLYWLIGWTGWIGRCKKTTVFMADMT